MAAKTVLGWCWKTAALWGALLSAGCVADFDRISQVRSLRILGVQKDKPFAQPGQEVKLSALWVDGRESPSGEVTFMWLAGCTNPPGEVYYLCFQDLDPEQAQIGVGSEFTYKIPKDVISENRSAQPRGTVPYGVSYVFFAACAGELRFEAGPTVAGGSPGLPLGCFDKETGTELTQADFVVGFTAVYSYEGLTHENPEIVAVTFNGESIKADCIGAVCVTDVPQDEAPAECDERTACVKACPDPDAGTCEPFTLSPVVRRRSPNEALRLAKGGEQIWVAYASDKGDIAQELKLISDPGAGFLEDYSTEITPPTEKGLMHVWMVVRDSYGGQNFARVRVLVN